MQNTGEFFAYCLSEARFPVVTVPNRDCIINEALRFRVTHWANEIGNRRAKLAQRREHALAFSNRPAIDRNDANDGCTVRGVQKSQSCVEFVGSVRQEFTIEVDELGSTNTRMDKKAGENSRKRVEAEVKLCDNAEVRSGTANRPEKIRMGFDR